MPASSLVFDTSKVSILAIDNQFIPKEGPKAIPLFLDFTLADSFILDFVMRQQQGFMSMVQTLFIDASGTDKPVVVTIGGTNQIITAKGRTQGYYSALIPNPVKLTVTCIGGPIGLQIFLINVPVPGVVWPTI